MTLLSLFFLPAAPHIPDAYRSDQVQMNWPFMNHSETSSLVISLTELKPKSETIEVFAEWLTQLVSLFSA